MSSITRSALRSLCTEKSVLDNQVSVNLPFLLTNADSAIVYATFWIERVTPKSGAPFMQLQYAQFVSLQFPAVLIPSNLPPPQSDQGKLNFSWPHVSVATLRKTFG